MVDLSGILTELLNVSYIMDEELDEEPRVTYEESNISDELSEGVGVTNWCSEEYNELSK